MCIIFVYVRCLVCRNIRRNPELTRKARNDLAQLKESGFGWPEPRHGLKQLHWTAKQLWEHNFHIFFRPECEDYGFHKFHNEPNRDGYILLPTENGLTYFTGGSLKRTSGKRLPHYVVNKYTRRCDDSNMDRVILGVDENSDVCEVYISEHYDHDATAPVSWELLAHISLLTVDEFLSETGYYEDVNGHAEDWV